MENTFETMVKHPFASAILIACITNGLANIIATLRGKPMAPIVNVVSEKK
jgi:hypothetical protein